MKMIDRNTILNILAQNHDDIAEVVSVDYFFQGILIISEYVGSVKVTPIKTDSYYTVKTIALDSMLAYNFSEEDVQKLHGLGWFIFEEYLTVERF